MTRERDARPDPTHPIDDPNGNNSSVHGPSIPHYRNSPAPLSDEPLKEVPYSGFVVVRMSTFISPGQESSLQELADAHNLVGLLAVLKRFGEPSSMAVVKPPVRGEKRTITLEGLEKRAARSSLPPIHSLRSYYRLDARALQAFAPNNSVLTSEEGLALDPDRSADLLVDQLNALAEVDLAYRAGQVTDSDVEVGLANFQRETYRSPGGLHIAWARHPGEADEEIDGKIPVVDLEQGWRVVPEDALLVHGDNRHGQGEYYGDHGSAVLGQLDGSKVSGLKVVGIAEGVAKLILASHFHLLEDGTPPFNGRVAEAIETLMTSGELTPGSILLLEAQVGKKPLEYEPLFFDAIRLASASGVIVVQPAGNGGFDLDRLTTADGRSLDRRRSGFQDSGAIFVGAADSEKPHDRLSFSNYGSRVDCFAWGDGVTTAGYGDLWEGEPEQLFTDQFSGTSSAAAMIGGIATLVQALYQQNAGSLNVPADAECWNRLSPKQMRALVSNPKAGTSQGSRVPGLIGIMPDLRKTLDDVLGIVPHVYLRDHEGDDGESLGYRRRFSSPDIVVESPKVTVNVRNRGLRPAAKVKALVYCAPLQTLLTPDRWKPIGKQQPSGTNIPQGDLPVAIPTVSTPKRLLTSHPSLIATVDSAEGKPAPRPCHSSAFNWPEFQRMLREQTNFAVRNIHEISGPQTKEFLITGAPDAPRRFTFEVLQRLPGGVSLILEAPLVIAAKLHRGRLWKVLSDRGNPPRAKLYLPKQPRLPLGDLILPIEPGFPCEFILNGSEGLTKGHGFAIRQLFEGEEVGRITWEWAPPRLAGGPNPGPPVDP